MQEIANGKPIKYTNAIIIGDLICPNLIIPEIQIEGSEIKGELNFENSNLKRSVSFADTKFLGPVNFINANFSSNPDFRNSIFEEAAFFNRGSFLKGANFELASFNKYASFLKSDYKGPAIFSQAHFNSAVTFADSQFDDRSEFEEIEFGNLAIFMDCQFNEDVSFAGAHFKNLSDFRYTNFRDIAEFNGARFDGRFNLNGAKFDSLNINWDIIKDELMPNGPIYLSLIKNFKNMEQLDDADNCYIRYRDWRRENRPFGFLKIYDYIAWLSCGYGIKPAHTVGLSALVIFLFGIIYWIGRAVPDTAYEDIAVRYIGTLFSALSVSLYFSAIAFLTPHASIELRPSRYWKYIILIEHVLGLMLMALFIVTLDRVLVRG